jgi:hypothetical protein
MRINGAEFGDQLQDSFESVVHNPHLIWEEVKVGQEKCYKTFIVEEGSSRCLLQVNGVVDCPPAVLYDVSKTSTLVAIRLEFD